MNTANMLGALLVAATLAVACTDGGADEPPAGSGEQDIVAPASACASITTLECKEGFETTTVGCLQSHVAGAAPIGKCVPKADTCAPIAEIRCAPGFEPSTVGCLQSHVAGASPLGKCVQQ